MSSRRDALTHAETNVLVLVDAGFSNQMIAKSMSIAIGTVKSHLHRTYEKLDARNRLDALAKARELGHFPGSGQAPVAVENITFDR